VERELGRAAVAELPALAEPEVWEGEGRAVQSQLAHAAPRLSVEGFEGPLDFLLEMVRRQRVDLGRLSILSLTDQLVAAIEDGGGRIPLERRGDWLVMASQLLLLKAQLLAPTSPEEAEDARTARRIRPPAMPCAARSGSWYSTFSVSTAWIAGSVKTRGRPRLPVPSSACQARSGESHTVRSPREIRPRSYSRQFRVGYC
jgi:hypothetical protein